MSYGYLLVVLIMLIFYSWLRRILKLQKLGNHKQLSFFFAMTYITTLIWDNVAVSSGHWQYKNMIGIYFGYSPIENILFAVVYPIAVITIFQIVERYVKKT